MAIIVNPTMYAKIFENEPDYDTDGDPDYVEEVPQTEGDIDRMMAELAALGIQP